jgi:ABC-type uncharacterized transport system involved in gliding motility auxiliary subunit
MSFDRRESFRMLGWLGAAMLAAGLYQYSTQEILTKWSKGLLIGGGVLLLAGMVLSFRDIAAFFSKRSSKLGSNVAGLTIGVLAILGVLNYLGFKHHKRFDLTTEKLYTISDQTKKVVHGLNKDVTIMRFGKTPNAVLKDTMAEYKDASAHIHYQSVDPQERPDLAKQYGVERMDQVVVESGTRHELLDSTDEQALTSAIIKVSRDTVKTVCFVEGHDEKSITAADGHGYSKVAAQLTQEDYQTKSVNLVQLGDVPFDCSVLVEAGPTKALFAPETGMIQKYLDNGGKAMILLDPDSEADFSALFSEWNISAPNNTVLDASGMGRFVGTGPTVPLVTDYGTSPISKNFGKTMAAFDMARTVSPANESGSAVVVSELLKTSAASFAVKKLVIVNNQVKVDTKTDQRGPLTLGVSAEKKVGEKSARLVVIGDSDFASNGWLAAPRNGDLFANSINWLAEDEDLISIRPKSETDRRVNLTETQQRGLNWMSLFVLPGVVMLTGVYIWWKRR